MTVTVAKSTSVAKSTAAQPDIVDTDIPARLDRLPWSRFHTLVVVALGVTWVLDGLEVTLAGTIAPGQKRYTVKLPPLSACVLEFARD